MLRGNRRFGWVIVTSPNGARAALDLAHEASLDIATSHWAAIGSSTAAVLSAAGAHHVWLPSKASGAALAEELAIGAGTSVLLLRGSLADGQLAARLRERGAEVVDVVAYETHEAPPASRALLEQALAGASPTALLLASPSAARGLLMLAADDLRAGLLALPAVCIGSTTAAEARALGYNVAGESARTEPQALAALAASVLASVAPAQ